MNWSSRKSGTAVVLVGLLLGSGCEGGWCTGTIASCIPNGPKDQATPDLARDMMGDLSDPNTTVPCTPNTWSPGLAPIRGCTMAIVNGQDTMGKAINVSGDTKAICYRFNYIVTTIVTTITGDMKKSSPSVQFNFEATTVNPEGGIPSSGADGATSFANFICYNITGFRSVRAKILDTNAYAYIEIFKQKDDTSCNMPANCQ